MKKILSSKIKQIIEILDLNRVPYFEWNYTLTETSGCLEGAFETDVDYTEIIIPLKDVKDFEGYRRMLKRANVYVFDCMEDKSFKDFQNPLKDFDEQLEAYLPKSLLKDLLVLDSDGLVVFAKSLDIQTLPIDWFIGDLWFEDFDQKMLDLILLKSKVITLEGFLPF